jgi:hypothetical protein
VGEIVRAYSLDMSSCYVSLLKIGHGELTTSPPGRFTVVRALYSFTHLCLFVVGGIGGSDVWLTKEEGRRLSVTG